MRHRGGISSCVSMSEDRTVIIHAVLFSLSVFLRIKEESFRVTEAHDRVVKSLGFRDLDLRFPCARSVDYSVYE